MPEHIHFPASPETDGDVVLDGQYIRMRQKKIVEGRMVFVDVFIPQGSWEKWGNFFMTNHWDAQERERQQEPLSSLAPTPDMSSAAVSTIPRMPRGFFDDGLDDTADPFAD